ncbi:hypothetical protein ACPR111641_09875 [Acinetobacter pragensis]
MICTGIHNVSVTFLKAISFIFRFKLLNSSQNLNLKIDFLTSDLPSLESLVFYFLQRYFYTADNKLNSAFSIQHSASKYIDSKDSYFLHNFMAGLNLRYSGCAPNFSLGTNWHPPSLETPFDRFLQSAKYISPQNLRSADPTLETPCAAKPPH